MKAYPIELHITPKEKHPRTPSNSAQEGLELVLSCNNQPVPSFLCQTTTTERRRPCWRCQSLKDHAGDVRWKSQFPVPLIPNGISSSLMLR